MRMLVNIRGCNGSGKTSIPAFLMDDPQLYNVSKPYKGKQHTILTVFPSYKWVALGDYHKKTGGLDQFPDNKLTKKAILYAIEHYDYDILMEGVIASTIYSTYAYLFKELEIEHEIKPIIVTLLPPFEVCLQRIYQRNGNKPIKEEAVRAKWEINKRNAEKFKQDGFISLLYDNSKTSKTKSIRAFYKRMDKLRAIMKEDWI